MTTFPQCILLLSILKQNSQQNLSVILAFVCPQEYYFVLAVFQHPLPSPLSFPQSCWSLSPLLFLTFSTCISLSNIQICSLLSFVVYLLRHIRYCFRGLTQYNQQPNEQMKDTLLLWSFHQWNRTGNGQRQSLNSKHNGVVVVCRLVGVIVEKADIKVVQKYWSLTGKPGHQVYYSNLENGKRRLRDALVK